MMQIHDLAESFLGAMQHTFLANTRRAYRYDLDFFARSFLDVDAAAVTASHLRSFLAATTDRAPSTLARRRAALRSCFAWAYRNSLVPADPTSHLDKITLPQRDPRPLDTAEVAALLAVIPVRHARNRLLFILLYETGLRVGEALALHTTDIHLNDIDGGYIRVVGKGNRERSVPLIDAPRSVRLLRSLLGKRNLIVPILVTHGPLIL